MAGSPQPSAPKAAAAPAAAAAAAPVSPAPQEAAPGKKQGRVDQRAADDVVLQLRRIVARNTRRWKRLIILEALGLTIAVPLGYFLLMLVVDNMIHLPSIGRYLACLLFFGAVGWFGWWLSRQWRQARFTEDQVALAIEKQSGGVENRLINAIQIAREAGSKNPELKNAVIQENYQRLKQIELQQASKMKRAMVRLSTAAALICVGMAFWHFRPDLVKNSTVRILVPFAKVAPVYRTILTVEPGNTQATPGSDVTITVTIEGQRPSELVIQRTSGGVRSSDAVPVNNDRVSYTFKSLERSVTYWVKGGDFSSPSYEIDVPTPPQINLVRVNYHYPEYTRLPDLKFESAGADLEALLGTRANLTFVLDQPTDEVTLLLEKVIQKAPSSKDSEKKTDSAKNEETASSVEKVVLKKSSPTEFTGEIEFRDVLGYQLSTQQGRQAPRISTKYGLHILNDQAPSLTLTGLNKQNEAQVSTIYPLKVVASDDYGLSEVGLFYARHSAGGTATNAAPVSASSADERLEWKSLITWKVDGSAKDYTKDHALAVASLGGMEGDKVEIALRGKDTDPLKSGQWTTGETYTVLVGGEGASFQVMYEQILQSEGEIRQLIAQQQSGIGRANEWIQKLDPASGMNFSDKTNLNNLGTAMREQARAQEELRAKAGAVARNIVQQAGNIRMSMGLLADTEMVRVVRILESVASRDNAQNMKSALSEGRLTQERALRSMQELMDQYVKFRQDWELANMTPFVKMLADRQISLREESSTLANNPPGGSAADLVQKSNAQRQAKVGQLSGLAQTAFVGITDRVKKVDEILGKAFGDASATLDSSAFKSQIQQAQSQVAAGRWKDALTIQAQVAETLGNVYVSLKKAQAEAAQKVLADKKDANKLKGQNAIEELGKNFVDNPVIYKESAIAAVLKMEEVKQAGADKSQKAVGALGMLDFKLDEAMDKAMRAKIGEGDHPPIDKYKLGTVANTPDIRFPKTAGLPPNEIEAPKIPDKLEDLVGKLLEAADVVSKEYENTNINAALTAQDTGVPNAGALRMNSHAAVAKTGNQKPPPTNTGGQSGIGRKGARAHGKVAGDDATNRRGRDEAQDGQEEVADQAGLLKEKKSEDMQKDSSVGVGGKRTASEDAEFSRHDAGQWKDKYAERMEAPKGVNKIVERQGKPIDAKVAEMLRELSGNQEQLIERVKTIKKELKNLYLPTDYLEDIMNQLAANLDRMKEKPDPEIFRQNKEVLDRLRAEMTVFNRAYQGIQPSVPREKMVKGRILDEPAWQTTPSYESAVKYYYEKLSEK
jgi:hypothetical protein